MTAGQQRKKTKRGNRPYDCTTCEKVPKQTREELVPLGIKFGPEKALDIASATTFLMSYHEVQAGAPFPDCAFTSRLYGIVHYMLAQDSHHAQQQSLRVPAMLRSILER